MNRQKSDHPKKRKLVKLVIILVIVVPLLIALVMIVLVNLSYKEKAKGSFSEFPGIEVIPFTYTCSGHILVPVQFDNDTTIYPFILDSGGSNVIFDYFPAKKDFPICGISLSIDAGGNLAFPAIRKTGKVKVGSVEFSGLRFGKVPFNWNCYDHVYGIIGKETMRNLAWQIDFENQRILVASKIDKFSIQPGTFKVKLSENHFSHHLYVTLATPDSISNTFIFDVGNSGALSIKQGNAKFDDVISNSIIELGSHSKGVTGKSRSDESMVEYPLLLLGDSLQLKNIWAIRSKTGLNLFGLGILNHFKITFDWVDKYLFLETKKELCDFNDSSIGFTMDFKDGNTFITSVIKNSMAYISGIRPGQKVVSLNGISLDNEDDFCNSNISKIDSLSVVVIGDAGQSLTVSCKKEKFDKMKKER